MGEPDRLPHFGDIKLARRLSSGGLFAVFEGYHETLHRNVAVKFIPRQFAQRNPKFVNRFRSEAQLAARLTHPAIIRTYYTGEAAGNHFVVMDLASGQTLDALVKEKGPQPPAFAVRVGTAVAGALYYALSTYDIMHRDINPGHIMVDGSGEVKIVGLGLAKYTDAKTTIINALEEAEQAEKVNFMAPEIIGRGVRPVDFRADIYSLGATLYYVLSGRLPFGGGKMMETVERVVEGTRPPLEEAAPGTPRWLAYAIEQMMKPDPGKRPPSYAAVAKLLNPSDDTVKRLDAEGADLSATGEYKRPDGGHSAPRLRTGYTTSALNVNDVKKRRPSTNYAVNPVHKTSGWYIGRRFLIALALGIFIFGLTAGMLICAMMGSG